MSELDPLTTEPTEPEQTKRGRKLGSKNKEKIDYDQRIEDLISAMNVLIEKGELTATIERAYNRQIEYFQFQIQRRDDAKKESRERELAKIKELEAQPPLLVPPVPDAKSIESERRVAKMLKELGEERERKKSRPVPVPEVEPPALYSRDLAGNLRLNIGIESVETKPKSEPKPSAEELEAAETEKQRIAKIDEDYAEVQKRFNRPLNAYERDMPRHQVKSRIAADNQIIYAYQKEHGLLPKVAATGGVDVEAIKRENAAVQREYQAEYDWQVGGCQTTRPTNFRLFRDED